MPLDLNAVMDGIGSRLLTIAGLRVFGYATDQVAPPAAAVGMPETVEYDQTYMRGADRVVFPVHLLVARVSDRASRDVLAPYVSGTGAKSVKAALDGTLAGTVQSARVMDATFTTYTVQGVDYLGATFRLEAYA